MDTYLCPHCGKKEMIKQKESNNKYILTCQACGFTRGVLPKDKKRGVV